MLIDHFTNQRQSINPLFQRLLEVVNSVFIGQTFLLLDVWFVYIFLQLGSSDI